MVTFRDNKAVSANQVNYPVSRDNKMGTRNGRVVIDWLVIYAGDEQESVKIANKVAEDYYALNYLLRNSLTIG